MFRLKAPGNALGNFVNVLGGHAHSPMRRLPVLRDPYLWPCALTLLPAPPAPPPVPQATFAALRNTYGFLSPDLWRETKYTKAPLQVRVFGGH